MGTSLSRKQRPCLQSVSWQVMIIPLQRCGPLKLPPHPRGDTQTCRTGSSNSVKRVLPKRVPPFLTGLLERNVDTLTKLWEHFKNSLLIFISLKSRTTKCEKRSFHIFVHLPNAHKIWAQKQGKELEMIPISGERQGPEYLRHYLVTPRLH